MFGWSQTTGYAIRALACLENSGSQGVLIGHLAERARLPKAYLARIINRLAHQGIVSTKRGYRGGATLARPASQISLLQVVEALEGKNWSTLFPWATGCGAQPVCPALEFWHDIRRQIENKLSQTTVADVIEIQPTSERVSNPGLCSGPLPAEPVPRRRPEKSGRPAISSVRT